jgi:hypothetical protein
MKLHTTLCLIGALAAGCGTPSGGRPVAREVGESLAVDVLADSAESGSLPPARLGATPARTTLTLVRIAPARGDVQAPLPLPEPAAPAAGGATAESPRLDDALRPPIARGPATLRLNGPRRGWLELDVRVNENGEVPEAFPVAGDADPATVRAAIEAAKAMRWYPATLRGRPVAVWCRQRFDSGPGR